MSDFVSTPTMRAYAAAVRAKVPVLLWGNPGEGKTATITAYGKAWGLHVETIVGSVREPSDYLGLPMEVDGKVVYSPPAWALNCNQATALGARGALLFLDELSTASPAVQKANLRLMQERYAGDLALADHVSIVAAANPPEIAADGWDLPAPVANRLMHLNWHFDADEWMSGVITGFARQRVHSLDQMLGKGDDNAKARARGLVTAFLTTKPEWLRPGVPHDDTRAGRAWPSPRSWTNVMNILGELDPTDEAASLLCVQGLVGDGAAVEFTAWAATADLHDPQAVLNDPSIVAWDQERPDRLFALLTSIAALVLTRGDTATWEQGARVYTACGMGNRADVALPGFRTLLENRPRDARIQPTAHDVFRDLFQTAGKWAAA